MQVSYKHSKCFHWHFADCVYQFFVQRKCINFAGHMSSSGQGAVVDTFFFPAMSRRREEGKKKEEKREKASHDVIDTCATGRPYVWRHTHRLPDSDKISDSDHGRVFTTLDYYYYLCVLGDYCVCVFFFCVCVCVCVFFFFWGGGWGGAEETRLNHWKSAVSASLCSPIPTDRARGVASLCLALPGAKPQASVYHILPPRKCAGKRGLASALGANSKHWFTTSVLQRCRKARLGMCMRSCVHLGCAPQRLVQFKPKDSSPRLVPRQHFPASSALNQSVSPVGSSEVVKFYTLYNCTFVSESWRRECWRRGWGRGGGGGENPKQAFAWWTATTSEEDENSGRTLWFIKTR